MRKDLGARPILYPQPVFIIGSYSEDGTPDAMNAAWGGLSNEDEVTLCLDAGHKTVENILKTGAFTLSMGTVEQVVACDYVGIVSGKTVPDKVARAGWHAFRAAHVDAPLFQELPMGVECTLVCYDPDAERMVGRIVNVCADECLLDEQGRIEPMKLHAITFDGMNHSYLALGEKVGNAFSDGKALK